MHLQQKITLTLLLSVFVLSNSFAQKSPFAKEYPFADKTPFKDTPVNRAESKVLMEFDRGVTLESVLSTADGSVYTTSVMDGKVYRIKNDKASLVFDMDGFLLCMEELDQHNILITASTPTREAVVYQLSDKGESKIIAKFPEGQMLNGITKVKDSVFLIADSYKGAIWKLDTSTGSVSMWLENELFEKSSPEEIWPGVNGIEVFNNMVYVSNTTKLLMARIPVLADCSAGEIEVIKKDIFVDDFTLDNKGNIYAATHAFDNVIKITPEGDVSIIAQYDQGVSGSTSVKWKYGSDNTLVVSADGGTLKLDNNYIVPARVVELRIK